MSKNPPTMPGLLAAVQTKPKIGDIDHNLEDIERAIISLEPNEHRLVVFPEMATTGYFLRGIEQLKECAEKIPEGPTTDRLISLAKEYQSHLVVGLPEIIGNQIYNTIVLVGPEGFIAKYQKLHLWSEEKLLFSPGNSGIVIADLPYARVGMMICYDLWFPEQIRILRMMGADVVVVSAALVWNDTPAHMKRDYYMANYVGMAAAHWNQVHLALASQVGHYGDQWLFGSSFIASPYGWLLGEPAGDQEPEILQTEIDFNLGRNIRGWGKMDDFDQDRRLDVYDEFLGYEP